MFELRDVTLKDIPRFQDRTCHQLTTSVYFTGDPDGECALPNQQTDDWTTRATAQLPGLEIEIVHRRPPTADTEEISIHLQATPSFEVFGRFIQAANPFVFWAQSAQMAWLPWLGAATTLLPWSGANDRGNEESSTQHRSQQIGKAQTI